MIDDEWFKTERHLSKAVHGKPWHGDVSARVKLPRRAKHSSSRGSAVASAPPASPHMVRLPAAWTPASDSQDALQRRIDELERQIAAAEVSVSDVERRAMQRKWLKERQAQRQRRGAEPRSSGAADISPEPLAAAAAALEAKGSGGGGGGSCAAGAAGSGSVATASDGELDEEPPATPTPAAAATLEGLALVVANLARFNWTANEARTRVETPTCAASGPHDRHGDRRGAAAIALLLASGRAPSDRPSGCEWKRRAIATVQLQRCAARHAAARADAHSPRRARSSCSPFGHYPAFASSERAARAPNTAPRTTRGRSCSPPREWPSAGDGSLGLRVSAAACVALPASTRRQGGATAQPRGRERRSTRGGPAPPRARHRRRTSERDHAAWLLFGRRACAPRSRSRNPRRLV